MAANIGILGVAVGSGLVTGLRLNFGQTLVAAIVGSLASFAFVALVSLAGPRSGAPTLVASRATFGVRGNLIPAVISWIVLTGLEVVMVTTAAAAVADIAELSGVLIGPPVKVLVAVLLVVGAAAVAFVGQRWLMAVQKWLGWLLAVAALVLIVIAISTVDWKAAFATPPGDLGSVMAGIGVVATGTGVSWMSAGADYTRYLRTDVTAPRVFVVTLVGAGAPIVTLVSAGTVLALGDSAAVGLALPDWLLIPYLVAAALGLFTVADLALYSAGLSLQAAGVPLKRPYAVLISAGAVAVALAVLLSSTDGQPAGAEWFAAALAVCAPPLVAWAGVFGFDMVFRRGLLNHDLSDTSSQSGYWFHHGFHWPAVAAWLAGALFGLACIKVRVGGAVWFAGPLADTWLGRNSLSWLVAGVWAAAVYWALEPLTRSHRPGRAHLDDGDDDIAADSVDDVAGNSGGHDRGPFDNGEMTSDFTG